VVFAERIPVTFGDSQFTTLTGKYHHLLPSIDYRHRTAQDMKLRASYGETIGRPRYDQIQGGTAGLAWRASMAAPAPRAIRR
jgi:hypothetical protein